MCTAQIEVPSNLRNITLPEFSLLEDFAAKELLTSIIIDETLQDPLKSDGILKPTGKKKHTTGERRYGIFHRVRRGNNEFMMYKSAYSATASSVPYNAFIQGLGVQCEEQSISCCEEKLHPFISPFFSANSVVAKDVKLWISKNPASTLRPNVEKILEWCNCLASVDEFDEFEAYMYNEDDWTRRLCKGLNFHPLLTDKVASFRFHDQAVLDEFRLQNFGVSKNFAKDYLFHGLPDIYWLPQLPQQLQLIQHVSDTDDTDATVPDPPQDAAIPQASGVDQILAEPNPLVGEIAKATQPRKYPFPKMGELLANMHSTHCDYILKHFSAGQYILKQFVVKGLFLHKETGYSHFDLDLKPTTEEPTTDNFSRFNYSLTHHISPCKVLNEQQLCAVLKFCTGINLHN